MVVRRRVALENLFSDRHKSGHGSEASKYSRIQDMYIVQCLSLASFWSAWPLRSRPPRVGRVGQLWASSYVIDTFHRRFLRSLSTSTCLSLASFWSAWPLRSRPPSLEALPRLRKPQALCRRGLPERRVVFLRDLPGLHRLVQLHGGVHQPIEDDERKVLEVHLQPILLFKQIELTLAEVIRRFVLLSGNPG